MTAYHTFVRRKAIGYTVVGYTHSIDYKHSPIVCNINSTDHMHNRTHIIRFCIHTRIIYTILQCVSFTPYNILITVIFIYFK